MATEIIRKLSLSARRAWIEIKNPEAVSKYVMSLSARRAWIEMPITSPTTNCFKSLSARRAWIEIRIVWSRLYFKSVALRKESVDRNST